MFSRTMPVLLRRRPPFASFFKAVSAPFGKARQVHRMQTAAFLWRKTAPQYGIRFSAPRVGAALRIYRKEGKAITRQLQMTVKPARKSGAAQRRSTPTRTTASKRKTNYVKRVRQNKKRVVTPFAAFRTEVMRRTKLPYTEANRKRVLRMWILTGQQRSLSAPKRVEMAVRLLRKDRKHAKRLSRKMEKIVKTRAKRASRKSRRKSAKRKSLAAVSSRKSRRVAMKSRKALKVRRSRKAGGHKSKKTVSMRASRGVLRRAAAAKMHRGVQAATTSSAPTLKSARKVKPSRRSAPRKGAASKRRVRNVRTAAAAKSNPKRRIARRARGRGRRGNPYIRFYRHMRMTGLIPNHPKALGSRQIKALWEETHFLKGLNHRIARATELLEKRTGSKSMVSPPSVRTPPRQRPTSKRLSSNLSQAPPAGKTLNTLTIKQSDIKVPSYYNRNPFGATYAALLPMLREIPSSTRMARVAKAWMRTSVKNDKRSAKARIAAVAEAMRK
ncbi:hypothetical protein CUR178_00620 [Leishmania enriettii]|uniref:Mkiaa0324 protein-like protein n=1 Tax=Leishmania enriettii TaxID=5663 RepID=A0A836KCL9_LEIEN|nr:hypothetical protein CUR178_00620 [Leishmania enriettii]